MRNEPVKPAIEYGELVYTTISGITNVNRIRLFDSCSDNWNDQLIHGKKLFYRTDQDVRLAEQGGKGYNETSVLNYDKIYFNGILIYNRSLYRRILDSLMFNKHKWKR